ncbi:hypothetical protein [Oleiagrimonas sp. MCCC 1A03011]|uniref:hypothetical protein n=1 Tax=Oleiagrimonas sp. MCCC 1A03011 TaxID=1926883 RepID=UPI0011BF207A|nr:hypothetical protein [Oleiagrimonas sp. MCCC 1A03011]
MFARSAGRFCLRPQQGYDENNGARFACQKIQYQQGGEAMSRFVSAILGVSAFLAVTTAFAAQTSVKANSAADADMRTLPVLVHVDKQGTVTDVTPAYKVRPSLVKVLRATLNKMITKPAQDHGKPISSDVVVTLALHVMEKKDGTHAANFQYVSMKPLPAGSWHWVHTPDHRLALGNHQGDFMQADPNATGGALGGSQGWSNLTKQGYGVSGKANR